MWKVTRVNLPFIGVLVATLLLVTYVPAVRERGERSRFEAFAVNAVLRAEHILGRLGRPFSADGLVVVAERT